MLNQTGLNLVKIEPIEADSRVPVDSETQIEKGDEE